MVWEANQFNAAACGSWNDGRKKWIMPGDGAMVCGVRFGRQQCEGGSSATAWNEDAAACNVLWFGRLPAAKAGGLFFAAAFGARLVPWYAAACVVEQREKEVGHAG